MEEKYNVELYTPCFNEEKILPLVIPYWKHMGLSHIYVYDNYSTDRTLEILAQYPDWITVEHYDSGNTLRSDLLTNIKRNSWKNSKADFVFAMDIDEVLWCDDFNDLYDYIIKRDYDVVRGIGTQIVMKDFPTDYENGFLHTKETVRLKYEKGYSKSVLFRPNKIYGMYYSPGCHRSNPKLKDNVTDAKILDGRDYKNGIYLLHLKYLGYDYAIAKINASRNRLSQKNIEKKWGLHNIKTDKEIIDYIDENWRKNRNDFSTVMNNSIND